MGDTGLEPPDVTSDKTNHLRNLDHQRAAKCAAPCAYSANPTTASEHSTFTMPDFGCVITAWPSLPASIRQRICALVEASELIANGTAPNDQDRLDVERALLLSTVPKGVQEQVL